MKKITKQNAIKVRNSLRNALASMKGIEDKGKKAQFSALEDVISELSFVVGQLGVPSVSNTVDIGEAFTETITLFGEHGIFRTASVENLFGVRPSAVPQAALPQPTPPDNIIDVEFEEVK